VPGETRLGESVETSVRQDRRRGEATDVKNTICCEFVFESWFSKLLNPPLRLHNLILTIRTDAPPSMEDRSGSVLAIAITFMILAWVTVGLRCYVRYDPPRIHVSDRNTDRRCRIFMVKGFGIDDHCMVVTLLFFTGYLASQIGGAVHGTGVRREKLSDEQAQTALHFWFFCEIFYTLSTCMLKIAVGFFLLRITVAPMHIWLIRFIMVVSAIVGVAYTSVVIFQCKPISFWWDLNPNHTGTCLSGTLVMNFTFVVSGLNAFADWVFAMLPVLIVKDLHMKKRMKVVVAGVIALAAM
jgi:hypothetical protein